MTGSIAPVFERMAFFLMIDYPDEKAFFQVLDALERRGVGYVEVGIPASDPFADGETIRRAHEATLPSLTRGRIVEVLSRMRNRYSFRTILMTYAESIRRYHLLSLEPWLYDAMLCLDQEVSRADVPGVVRVFSEETTDEQMKDMLTQCTQFAYIVSAAGKTGGGGDLPTKYVDTIKRIRRFSKIPTYVGFGIKSADDICAVLEGGADGSVIGSELIRHVDLGGVDAAEKYIDSLGMGSNAQRL